MNTRPRARDRVQANAVAVCSCKRRHTLATWLALPLVGDFIDDTVTPFENWELRNCKCGSTIAAGFTVDENGVRFYEEKL